VPGYLDHASSEPLAPQARQALLAALDTGWADPARLHTPARQARLLLDNARAAVAESLGVRADEISFTSSGTHAVHLGLLGLLQGRHRVSRRLLATAVEHSAVFAAGRWWGQQAGEGDEPDMTTLEVDGEGRVRLDAVADGLARPAGAVAVQQVNPEVGSVQPIERVAALSDAAEVPLFVDACATAGLLPLPLRWDAAALSAHKWGGPAGLGVLLVRKGSRWRMPHPTDDRPDPRTSGFENVPAALAAAAALQARVAEREELLTRYEQLGARLVAGLAGMRDVDVHGPPVDAGRLRRTSHIVSFSFLYVDGETLVHELDRRGIRVASGSACTASALEPSHVLVAMGALTHGNVRVSFGPETTPADVDDLLAALHEIVPRLRESVS
jgi:cysteine desulfurase